MNFFIKYTVVATLSLALQNAYALKATCHSSQDPKLGTVEVETFSTAFGERARIKNNGDESLLPCSTYRTLDSRLRGNDNRGNDNRGNDNWGMMRWRHQQDSNLRPLL